jgi:hypothetical protein
MSAPNFGAVFDKMKKISTDEQYKKILEIANVINGEGEKDAKNKLCDKLQVELELFADRISVGDLPLVRKILAIDLKEYEKWLSLSHSDSGINLTFFGYEVVI